MKKGYLLGFKGDNQGWYIDFLVNQRDGKYVLHESELFDEDVDLVRMENKKWVSVDKDGGDEKLGDLSVHAIEFMTGEQHLLVTENMGMNSAYRMTYLTEEEYRESLWIRCKGGNLVSEGHEVYGNVDIVKAGVFDGDNLEVTRLSEMERLEIMESINEDAFTESVLLMKMLTAVYAV